MQYSNTDDELLLHPDKPCSKNYNTHTCLLYNGDLCCVYCLWKATENEPIVKMKITDVIPFEEIRWNEGRAMDMVICPDNEQYYRIHGADLGHPILIQWVQINSKNEIDVIDGLHRLAKAYVYKIGEINCRWVLKEALDKCLIKKNTNIY